MTDAVRADRPLSRQQTAALIHAMVGGALSEQQIREALQAIADRGETAEEIAGAVDALRRHAVALPVSAGLALCDTCGTGGDKQHTLNVSTLAALVVASCGVPVAKHGNRAASSRCGSADVLAALGLSLDAPPERVARSIETLGFGFCFAPAFHPAMKVVAPIRKAMGIRTIFNVVGPLANPARLASQLIGVSESRLLQPVAEALKNLGIRHALVVHGHDGLDEVSTTGPSHALDVRSGSIRPMELTPEAVGLPRVALDALRGGDPDQNALHARAVLGGAPGAGRDIVAFNAGCALYAADRAADIATGVATAQAALADGRALRLLDQVIAHARGEAPA